MDAVQAASHTGMIRLAFVGPMLGRHPGHVAVMGEVLGNLFAREGYPVVLTSRQRWRFLRLADMAATLIARRNQIDVQVLQVYSGLSFIGEDLASWLGQRLGQKLILHVHGGGLHEFMARFPRWSRRVLRRADLLVVPSPFLARPLASCGPPVRIVPNVIDLPAYPYRLRRQLSPRLFWMRTFHPVYNPEMAVRVLGRVKEIFPDATLVIAGQDKGLQGDVERLAGRLRLHDAVRFPGYLDAVAKAREGSRADIYLNTNRVDNMPVSVIEACAMGLPVVSTNVGGMSDLLTDGETGLLVPDGDDRAMAEAVLRLLGDAALAERLSANGRKLAERSAWDRVRPQWDRVFAELMAGTAGNAGGMG